MLLNNRRDLLRSLIPQNASLEIKHDNVSAHKTNLENTSFIVSISKSKQLKALTISKILQKALVKYGIDCISYDHTSISISAESAIDKTKVQKISEYIKRNQNKELSIEKLHQQLLSLNDLMNSHRSITSKEEYDTRDDRINHFELLISVAYKNVINPERLHQIFGSSLVTIKNSNHEDFTLKVSGYEPGDSGLFEVLLSDIEARKESLESKTSPTWVMASPKHHKHIKPAHHASTPAAVPAPLGGMPLARVIQWASATYNSLDKDCPVIQLTPYIFVYLALTLNNFLAAGLDEKCFKHISEKVKRAKLAAPVGEEGIVPIPKHMRAEMKRQYGTFFDPFAKLKLLKKYGDLRTAASEEVSITGEKLWKLEHLVPRAH